MVRPAGAEGSAEGTTGAVGQTGSDLRATDGGNGEGGPGRLGEAATGRSSWPGRRYPARLKVTGGSVAPPGRA